MNKSHFYISDEDQNQLTDMVAAQNQQPIVATTGLRYNEGKVRVDLVPPSSIVALAEVMTAGAKKYAENNWRAGMDWNICYASCMRHLLKWQSGEDLDSETGLNHLKHALTNIAFLIEYTESHPDKDNRYKK